MRRAFSLIELSIALAMAGIVIAAAASAGVVVTRILKLDAKKSTADQDSRRLVDFLLGELQTAGGGPVRPWMALWHEESGCGQRNGLPACAANTDRLTIVDVDSKRQACPIIEVASNGVRFGPGPIAGSCCYDWNGQPTNPELPDQFHGQTVMLVSGRSSWALRTITEVTNSTECRMGLSGDLYFGSWTAPAGTPQNFAPVPNGRFVATFDHDAVEVSAIAVRPRTLFVEVDGPEDTPPRPPRLVEWFDTDGNGICDPCRANDDDSEARLVFPGVMSFHVALGYDGAGGEDGKVTDAASASDEWRGNAASDSVSALLSSQLRMGQVGVITGTRAVDPGLRTLRVLNGTTVTSDDFILRRAIGKTMLRNVALPF